MGGNGMPPVGYGMNEDFMMQYYMNQLNKAQADTTNTTANTGSEVGFKGSPNNEAAADTFTRQGSGPDGGTLGIAALGAAGAGAYKYFNTSPLDADGKFTDEFFRSFSDPHKNDWTEREIKRLTSLEKQPILAQNRIPNEEVYNAIKKRTTVESIDALTEAERNLLPRAYRDKNAAQTLVNTVEEQFKNINAEDIAKKAAEAAKKHDYNYHVNLRNNVNSLKTKIAKLADTAGADELEKLIIKNPEAFGISGTAEQITAQAKALARQGKSGLLTKLTGTFTASDNIIKRITTSINQQFVNQFDAAKGVFAEGTRTSLAEGLSKMKLKSAGKWAAIATACVFALKGAYNSLFGSSNS